MIPGELRLPILGSKYAILAGHYRQQFLARFCRRAADRSGHRESALSSKSKQEIVNFQKVTNIPTYTVMFHAFPGVGYGS